MIIVGPERPIAVADDAAPLIEPVVVASPTDPNRLIAAAMSIEDEWRAVTFTSHDRGATWKQQSLPLAGARTSGDPWLAWHADGTVLMTFLAAVSDGDDERFVVRAYRSPDGGDTWTDAEQLPMPERGSFDHPVIATDPRAAGRAPIYVVGTFGLSGFAVVRAERAAARFETLNRFVPDDLNNNLGSAVALGDDTLVFTHFDMSNSDANRPLWAVVSRDGGATFARNQISMGVTPWGFPMLAADYGSGAFAERIYAVWLEGRQATGLEVVLAHSDDRGIIWSAPRVVDGDPSGTFRGRPFVGVNQAGVVGVTWNDRRHDDGAGCSDVYFSASVDGGASFLPERRVSGASSCAGAASNAPAAGRWPMGGDYSGMAVGANGDFRIIWADSRGGVYRLYTAAVEVRPAP